MESVLKTALQCFWWEKMRWKQSNFFFFLISPTWHLFGADSSGSYSVSTCYSKCAQTATKKSSRRYRGNIWITIENPHNWSYKSVLQSVRNCNYLVPWRAGANIKSLWALRSESCSRPAARWELVWRFVEHKNWTLPLLVYFWLWGPESRPLPDDLRGLYEAAVDKEYILAQNQGFINQQQYFKINALI